MLKSAGFTSDILKRYLAVSAFVVALACVSILYFSIRLEKIHHVSHLVRILGNNAFQISYLERQFLMTNGLDAQTDKSGETYLVERKRLLEESGNAARELVPLFQTSEAVSVEELMATLKSDMERFNQRISNQSFREAVDLRHTNNSVQGGEQRRQTLQTFLELQSKISDINELASLYEKRVHHGFLLVTAFWLLLIPSLSIFFFKLTARSFVSPINELAKYIFQLGAGDLDSKPHLSPSAREFRYLSETLEAMARNLKRTMVSRQELSNSQALLETILHGITDGIISTDMKGNVIYANRQAAMLFDAQESDLIGKNYEELVRDFEYFEEDGTPIPGDQMVIGQALRGASQLPRTVRRRRKNGNAENNRWVIAQAVSLCDEHAKTSLVVAMIRDITEQKRIDLMMEQQKLQLAHSARLSSVGVMAAGIAHEINNPLTVIQRRAEQIIEILDEHDADPIQIKSYAEKIVGFSKRITKIIRSLKSMSRNGEHDSFETVSIRTVIDDSLELCREKFRNHGIELVVELPEHEVNVECRSSQISQVLLNLFNNAFDAVDSMPGAAEKWVKVSVTSEGGDVVIRVADSGPGVPRELRHKIGIPFFTTKEAGKGTGLGISMSQSIMHLHHGTLKLAHSSSSTCFVLRFPEKQTCSEAAA